MSLGCNACGVTGCRIIDSPRERLIAILTASLVPCNGKFPTLIALITIFFVGGLNKIGYSQLLEGLEVGGFGVTWMGEREERKRKEEREEAAKRGDGP